MSDTAIQSSKFEVRPSAAKAWNPDAPDEVVLTDGKARGFGDLLQALNPLQNLPIVGTIYRGLTGETIEPSARVLGGLIYGGPIGIASALVNAIVEDDSGKDIGGHMLAMVSGPEKGNIAPPPGGDSLQSGVQLAALRRDGTFESNDLLATWIAGGSAAPRNSAPETFEANLRQNPSLVPSEGKMALASLFTGPAPKAEAAPVQTAQAVAAAAPIQTAPIQTAQGVSPAEPEKAAAMAPDTGGGVPAARGARTLADYRANAQSAEVPMVRMPVASDPIAGQNARRTLASYREANAFKPPVSQAVAQAQPSALPAALEAQLGANGGGNTAGGEQGWVAMMMGTGLDRYREMQRQRDLGS
ncbi:MAG: hypothetical protein C6Y20_09515 [Tagaea sp. CACIAM 22H2]|nr:hypothetical protein [Tagaea sp. CACIAM 22H2]